MSGETQNSVRPPRQGTPRPLLHQIPPWASGPAHYRALSNLKYTFALFSPLGPQLRPKLAVTKDRTHFLAVVQCRPISLLLCQSQSSVSRADVCLVSARKKL